MRAMITTHVFGFATDAEPRRVWSALTEAAHTRRYLRGVALESTWAPGAQVVLRQGDVATGAGEVLNATTAERLSLVVDGGHGPDTYLTWTIRPVGAGSVVRLYVDSPGGAVDEDEVEEHWLPVMADLFALLAGAEVR